MKIYDRRFYLLARIPGISGFKRFAERELVVVTGKKARLERGFADLLSEYRDAYWTNWHRFRLADGRLPEFQEIATPTRALDWLAVHPFNEAVLTNPDETLVRMARGEA